MDCGSGLSINYISKFPSDVYNLSVNLFVLCCIEARVNQCPWREDITIHHVYPLNGSEREACWLVNKLQYASCSVAAGYESSTRC